MATTTQPRASIDSPTTIGPKSSPSSPASGPDSEIASVLEELPKDGNTNNLEENKQVSSDATLNSEDLTVKVSAGANYLGSMFSTAWTKTAKSATEATATSSNFLTSTFNKVGTAASSAANSTKSSPKNESKPIVEEGIVEETAENTKEITAEDVQKEANVIENKPLSSFFSSAWTKVEGFTKSTTTNFAKEEAEMACHSNTIVVLDNTGMEMINQENQDENTTMEKPQVTDDNDSKQNFFSNFSSIVGKVANNATTVIKDKVNTSMIAEFNKEQEDFIKNKVSDNENNGLPPWVGYQDEAAMKEKILSLSNDTRNFVRAPPSGVSFEFDYASVSTTAMALLQEDPQLEKMRYELVPKKVREDEFWRNYFYRVSLIKQSFDLKDFEENSTVTNQQNSRTENTETSNNVAEEEVVDHHLNNPDHDDEFVSESYQASTEDINEANASMKRLGVTGNDNNEEWEAELEGELNEFEMVNSKEEDPEWENQIQQMLDAEEKQN